MLGQNRERWMDLCELAAKEQDPEKLLKLVQQINQMLEEKQTRLDANRKNTCQNDEQGS